MLSVADFILAICWLLGGVLWLQAKASHYFGFCYFLAIVTVVRRYTHTSIDHVTYYMPLCSKDCRNDHFPVDNDLCPHSTIKSDRDISQ